MKRCGMLRRVGAFLPVVVLAGLLLIPSLAFATDASVPVEKDETVYVYTTADGTVKNVEVSTILKNPNGAVALTDSSNLTDIKGDGEASFTGSGSSISWNSDGGNVSYKGVSSFEAPVSMRVSYTLDGQPVSPDDLAGKSGKVAIRYDFENHSTVNADIRGVSRTIYTPFTCITAVMFDGRDFKNVTVENGKVINDGDDMIVAGFAMPGLKESLGSMADDADVPDHFTITADVSNFELKSTMTIATAGIMSEFDANSLGIENLDGASALTDAMGTLIEGSDKLASGLDELASNMKQLEASAGKMADGSVALSYGIVQLGDGLGQLESGAGALANGIDVIKGSAADLSARLEQASSALKAAAAVDFDAALVAVEGKKEALGEDYETVKTALVSGKAFSAAVGTVAAGLDEGKKAIDEKLVAGVEEAKKNAAALVSGAQTAASSAETLSGYAYQMEEGAALLKEAMPQLAAGAQAAADGSKQLTQGMRTFNDEGVAQLVDKLQNDFGGTLDRMNALSDAAKAYTNFGGITDGTTGSVKFVFETDPIKKA